MHITVTVSMSDSLAGQLIAATSYYKGEPCTLAQIAEEHARAFGAGFGPAAIVRIDRKGMGDAPEVLP